MTPVQVLLIWIAVLFASVVRGLTGFGLAIVMVPLIGIIIAPQQAVLVGIMSSLMMAPLGYATSRKRVDPAVMRPLLIATVTAAPFGLWLLTMTPPDIARLAIAGIAIGSFPVLLAKRAPHPPGGVLPRVATGMLTGLLAGFAAMPGPPVIFYFVRHGIAPAASRDAMIVTFFWSSSMVALAALVTGRFTLPTAALALSCYPALALGNTIGSKLFGHVNEAAWRAVTLAIMAAAALGAAYRVLG
ncbi:sulfite exporter TauE/SafE family protein [Polymorphobacter arshaanensis]|uniref:sulfite exporter TauE/SafE family protein n=1 Tax=Glacieibacterium arshaanense TaxID=2511025 RepID=UPI00140958DA|nr:sulfite exporter TauE/SafE family protein [Polymorphobacter arshaanensis]